VIELTAWSGGRFFLNPDMIVRIDETPDTVVTLKDGTPIVIKDKAEEVVERIIAYRRQTFSELFSGKIAAHTPEAAINEEN